MPEPVRPPLPMSYSTRLLDSYALTSRAARSRRKMSWPVAISACVLTIMLLIALGEIDTVHARGAPNRGDRRPDRETRIRYPRSRPNRSDSSSSRSLRSAPPTATSQPSDQTTPEPTAPE